MSVFIGIDPCYGPKSVMGVVLIKENTVIDFAVYTFNGHRAAKSWTSGTKLWYAAMAHACVLGWTGSRTHRLDELPTVCIEEPHGSNYSTHGLREMVGILKSKFDQWGWPTVGVAATSAKKRLTGNGLAKKEDMVEAANKIIWLGDLKKKEQEAVADAIGIALAGANKWEAEHKDKP